MSKAQELCDDIDGILKDAKWIMSREMRRFREIVKKGEALSLQDSLAIRNYVAATLKIAAEERAIEDFKRINTLSDEEIKLLMAEMIKKDPFLKDIAKEGLPNGIQLSP